MPLDNGHWTEGDDSRGAGAARALCGHCNRTISRPKGACDQQPIGGRGHCVIPEESRGGGKGPLNRAVCVTAMGQWGAGKRRQLYNADNPRLFGITAVGSGAFGSRGTRRTRVARLSVALEAAPSPSPSLAATTPLSEQQRVLFPSTLALSSPSGGRAGGECLALLHFGPPKSRPRLDASRRHPAIPYREAAPGPYVANSASPYHNSVPRVTRLNTTTLTCNDACMTTHRWLPSLES